MLICVRMTGLHGSNVSDHENLPAYRAKVRAWFAANVPRLPLGAGEFGQLPGESERAFAARSRALLRMRNDAGLAGIAVLKEFGGQGLTQAHHAVFDEEAAPYETPGIFGGTFGPIFPALLQHFSPEQKLRPFPAMFAGDEFWVQLMS